MQAVVGDNPDMFYTPAGVFTPGSPMASKAGLDAYVGKRDYDRVKQEIKAAGYAGERTVLIVPTDNPRVTVLGDVAADMMHRVGFNVDYAATDFGTLIQRRTNKGPVEQGGWSAFLTGASGQSWMNPADHIAMRGNGDQPSAMAGWYVSPRIEALRNNWFRRHHARRPAENLRRHPAAMHDRRAVLFARPAPGAHCISCRSHRHGQRLCHLLEHPPHHLTNPVLSRKPAAIFAETSRLVPAPRNCQPARCAPC
jgi:hypothetical protein